MKIEEFEKLIKTKMVEEYKKLLQDFVDLEGSIGDKEELDEVKKNLKILNSEHNKLKQTNLEQLKKIDELEGEVADMMVPIKEPPTEPEDGDVDGIPWSQLPEDKLVEVVRAQGSMLNKQARKLKKYKKLKK